MKMRALKKEMSSGSNRARRTSLIPMMKRRSSKLTGEVRNSSTRGNSPTQPSIMIGDLERASSESNVATVEEVDSESWNTSLTVNAANEHGLRKSQQISISNKNSPRSEQGTQVDKELLDGSNDNNRKESMVIEMNMTKRQTFAADSGTTYLPIPTPNLCILQQVSSTSAP